MQWAEKCFEGQVYGLSHLDPFTLLVSVAETNFKVRVSFYHHCFTEKWDTIIHSPDYRYVAQNGSDLRAFNLERYELSKSLPDIIRRMPTGKVCFTNEQNFLKVNIIDHNGEAQKYVIFFKIIPARSRSHDVAMLVQSAYIKESLPKNIDKIRFTTLVRKVAAGEVIKSPRVFQNRR